MTQPIDPTQWPKVEGTAPERGVYFSVHKTGGVCAMPYQKGETHSQSVTLYGPITFATGKNMPQVIDLSHFDLSKIEPKRQPDKPGVWAVSNRTDGVCDSVECITQEFMDGPGDFDEGEYRYLCDFIPPKQSPVIPPKPENVLHLMRLTKVVCGDDVPGEVQWCIKCKNGRFYIVDDNGEETSRYWLPYQCEPVTE